MNKRILTGVLAAVMAVSLTACSDRKESGGNSTPTNNSTTNSKNSDTTSMSTENISDEENDPISFALKDEIKDAPISANLIQIGNDIFKNGGYMTIREFFEKYPDFESEIGEWGRDKLDEQVTSISKSTYVVNSKTDIKIRLDYTRKTDECIFGDCVIMVFNSSGEIANKNTWFSPGFNSDSHITEEELKKYLDEQGIKFIEGKKVGIPNTYRNGSDYNYKYLLFIEGDTENLFGVKPVVYYNLSKDDYFDILRYS